MNQEQIAEALGNLTAPQLVALTKKLEADWGVQAVPNAVSVPTVGPVTDGPKEEQTEFTVILTAVGGNKIGVIKAVREATGLGLKEAKELVESAPKPIKESISKDDAEALKAALTAVGATIEIK